MQSKILNLIELKRAVEAERERGRRVVFTNGCFDILHVGHVTYLEAARGCGDLLVVGLNSDRSVRTIKGEKRPVVTESQRARVLAALSCVDYVTIFDEPDPYNLISALRPHVLVKGADWAEADIIGADVVRENGGRVERIRLEPEISTSIIIEKILKNCSCQGRHRQRPAAAPSPGSEEGGGFFYPGNTPAFMERIAQYPVQYFGMRRRALRRVRPAARGGHAQGSYRTVCPRYTVNGMAGEPVPGQA